MFIKRIYTLVISFFLAFTALAAQSSDSLIINEYAEVKAVLNKEHLKRDSLVISPNPNIGKGDIIMIHQVKGAIWGTSTFSGTEFAGRFEIQVVDDKKGDTLILRNKVDSTGVISYNAAKTLQVIKVPSYKTTFKPNKILTAKPFDGATGGVFAVMADTIELNTTIDVSGKGFQGANPGSEISLGICWVADSLAFNKGSFTETGVDSAGLKGESVVKYIFSKRRGWDHIGTGGGGGNGYHSGGGGGSSFGKGGNGGAESAYCSITKNTISGSGGYQLGNTAFFSKYTIKPNNIKFGSLDTIPVAILGGGGGASTQAATFNASAGGNGGGIILIIANVLRTTNGQILANGSDVVEKSSAGGGGGGGGGAILLDINDIVGNPLVSVKGGNGGHTVGENGGVAIKSAGPGGGGGAGYILHHGDTLMASVNTVQGLSGRTYNGFTQSAGSGSGGITLSNLNTPIKGFLFNKMPSDQEICAGEVPKLLKASQPKGGKNYRFVWRKSLDNLNWDSIANVLAYQPDTLYDTTYYQRVVHSYVLDNGIETIVQSDSSETVVVKVLPAIINNIIHNDTFEVCKGKAMPSVSGSALSGGKGLGSYTYLWQDSVTKWNSAAGVNNKASYLSIKNDSIILRRVVKSGVCTSYSNEFKIDVLPLITGNVFSNQYIEMGRIANPLKSESIKGGKGYYTFTWEQSGNKTNWIGASGINSELDYSVPKLNDTIYYRRIIQSGQKNTCESISLPITIFMLDSLSKNTITGTMLICAESVPSSDFMGSNPIGGDGVYKYLWEISKNLAKWDTAKITTGVNFNPGRIDGDCFYRRIVLSGPFDSCKDTSNYITITTKPALRNFSLLKSDTTICYNQNPGLVKAKSPSGGDGAYFYQWYISNNNINWQKAPDNSIQASYQFANLFDTSFVFRQVTSGICVQNSDTLKVTVLPTIQDNNIISIPDICYGTKPDSIIAQQHKGGDGNYIYTWFQSSDNSSWTKIENYSLSKFRPDTLYKDMFYKRAVFSGLSNCCRDTSNSSKLIVNNLPTASLTGFNDSLCLGDQFLINFQLEGKPNFDIYYSNGFESTTLANIADTLFSHSVKPDNAGKLLYQIDSLIDANGCKAKNISGLGYLHVFKVPNALVDIDTATCGLEVQLKAYSDVGSGLWTSAVKAQFSPSDTVPNATVKLDSGLFGVRTFTWTLNNGGCLDSAHQKAIFYQPPPDPLVGESIGGPFLFKTNLKAYLPVLGNGKWTTSDASIVFGNPLDPESSVENLKLGKNLFFWYVENGLCIAASDSFIVDVQDIRVPNGFSPNNDTKNDSLVVKGLEHVKDAELIVVNKWGKEVFKSNNYQNNWNGQSNNGDPLPTDTYYYMLNVIDRTYKGYIVIKR